jgi:hypothetical protein
LKLRASANADTKQEAIGLALKKLAAKSQKAKHQGKKPVSLPKVEKTWRNGIISVEVRDNNYNPSTGLHHVTVVAEYRSS